MRERVHKQIGRLSKTKYTLTLSVFVQGKPSHKTPKKKRFFQLSHDGSTLRWSWNKYIVMYYVEVGTTTANTAQPFCQRRRTARASTHVCSNHTLHTTCKVNEVLAIGSTAGTYGMQPVSTHSRCIQVEHKIAAGIPPPATKSTGQ